MRWLLLMVVAFAVSLPGCRTRDFRTEGDVLRARVMELEREIVRMERHNAELAAELRRMTAHPESLSAEVHAHVPNVAEISIGRLSHVRDTTGDGLPNELRVYVQPLDGRGRFVQAVGELSINAAILPRDREAMTIGRIALPPAEIRDAYRSLFTGTHYTVVVPVSISEAAADLSPAELERAVVRVVFTDALTGLTHTAERVVSLRP